MRSLFFRFNHIIEIATDVSYFSGTDKDSLKDVSDDYPNVAAFDILNDDKSRVCFMAVVGDRTHTVALRDSLIKNPISDEIFNAPDIGLKEVTLSECMEYVIDHWEEIDRIIWGI